MKKKRKSRRKRRRKMAKRLNIPNIRRTNGMLICTPLPPVKMNMALATIRRRRAIKARKRSNRSSLSFVRNNK